MAAPAETPVWNTDATNRTTPSGTQQASGWNLNQTGVSSFMNWWMFWVYQWILWFNTARKDLFEMHQNWIPPMTDSWTEIADNGATFTTVINAAANKPGLWAKMSAAGDAAAAVRKYGEQIVGGPWPASLFTAMEFRVDAASIAGTDDYIAVFGFVHDESTDPFTEDAFAIRKDAASANWKFETSASGGSVTSTNTGVAPSGVQLMRIEMYGSGWPGGARALLYIDDVLKATHTTNLPAGQQMRPFVGFDNDDTDVAVKDIYLSPVTVIMRKV